MLCYSTFGLSAWSESTDSEVSVTARSLDGTGSGWSGHAHRDVTKLAIDRVVREAKDIALRSRGAVRFEPGRRTAILSATAVGQLMKRATQLFNGTVSGVPFVLNASRPDGRTTRITEHVADPRVTLWTDPSDADNGDVPFFDLGYPSGRATWIERGVLKTLSYDPIEAGNRQITAVKPPFAMQMSGGDTSIAQMIATCDLGIYVNRFSDVTISDWQSGTMTGTTRDGCFLVKDGKIIKPITNFRFYESPVLMLTKILALGTPERVAFGFSPPRLDAADFGEPWPYAPVVMPPMTVRDFNFSAMSDAV
jgi:predicted Zn-dependent protease